MKPQQVQVDAWLSNTISEHRPNSHELSCASQLAAHSKYLKSHKTSCAFQLAARAKCLRSQASCIAFGTLVCPSVASTNMIKADSDVGNLLFHIFKADSNFIQYLSSIHWQINKMCNDAINLSMAAKICLNSICHNGDVTKAAPTIFCDKSRRLVVEYILGILQEHGRIKLNFPHPLNPTTTSGWLSNSYQS
jgi:hypothetical protein